MTRDLLQASVDAGDVVGAVALVDHGTPERFVAARPDVPFTVDSLFRIASLTKPITSVAALRLMETGRFALEDPITRWAPEFHAPRVAKNPNTPHHTEPTRAPTFFELLTQTAGLTYGAFWPGPYAEAAKALGGDLDSPLEPDAWVATLSSLPLIDHPGHTFHYGHSTDLLGVLLERMADAPLQDVLDHWVLQPLEMVDTHFVVPEGKRVRRAPLYGFDDAGVFVPRDTCPGGSTVADRPASWRYVSGGQGLWSTVEDYGRFARSLARGGLLRPETRALMMRNHLSPAQRQSGELGGLNLFSSGHGYGFGVAVVMEPDAAMPTICGGGVGAVGWPGGFGGWFQADPNDGAVAVFLTHNLVEPEQAAYGIGYGVYKAITAFQAAL